MRIKTSKRGLTFSFQANEHFTVGSRYRYILDVAKNEIVIVPDVHGTNTVSRKGPNHKPLIDIRSSDVKELIAMASYLEIRIEADQIQVSAVKEVPGVADQTTDMELAELISREEHHTVTFDRSLLLHNDPAIYQALETAGLFSGITANDISCVFDVISLFSGAGLLDYPFHMDRAFDIKAAVDFDEDACETYRCNIGNHILCADMREVEPDMLHCQKPDLIIGGPCCQGYSNANRHNIQSKTAEEKRSLVDDYNRIVKAKQPYLFVIENVPQFITKEKGKYLERVLSSLPEYRITYQIVSDLEVGGYTKRRRMILIGSRIGKVIIPDVELSSHRTAGDALVKVDDTWFNVGDITKPGTDTMRKMSFVRPGHNYKDIPEMKDLNRHSDTYRRLAMDEPAPTIVNWRKVNMMPPVGNRILSVSEVAALMGLPKKFHLFGSLNSKQQQLGNGVTIAIASFVKALVKNKLYAFANEQLCLAAAV